MKLIYNIGHLKRKVQGIFLLYVSFVFLFYGQNTTAQDTDQSVSYTITGRITDSLTGETLIGVNIYLKDTKYGTVSDFNGNFSLEAPGGNYTLVFSYIGYNQKGVSLKLKRDLTLNISLSPTETEIEEVTVTAQRKFFGNMDYGREIPTISTEVIERQNVNNASDILHARVAGVWATKTSGAPGDHQKIRIRGQSSFFSSAEPLYVVDGVPIPIVNLSSLGIADLNIHDIENVTVLKDASASSLYGFQGGNGVVLIDTKKGDENRINFLTRFGYQWQPARYDLMNTKDFLTTLDSALSVAVSGIRNIYPAYSDSLCDKNLQDAIFSNGSVQEYQLSASGTQKMLKYYFSGNYTDHKGILPNSQYNRYTFSARVGRLFWKRLAIDIGYRGSWQTNKNNQDQYKGNPLIFEGIPIAPCLDCTPDSLLLNDRGELYSRTYYMDYNTLSEINPISSILDNNHHELQINSNILYGLARLRISDHFYMDFMESFMKRHSFYNTAFTYTSYDYMYGSRVSAMIESLEDVMLFNHQMNISYNNTFGRHELGAVLAHRYYKDNLWWEVDSLEGSIPEHFSLKNSMATYGPKGSVYRTMSSYVGHLSYSYRKTWFLSLIGNLSHVKEGLYTHYYQLFPSIAVSWDISQLSIFDNIAWFDLFKIYANHGISGNYPLNGLANDLYDDYPFIDPNGASYYPAVIQLANHDLRHESTTETDYGLQTSFFNRRISLSGVYYSKLIDDLIMLRDIPEYYGGGKQYLNIGQVAVEGYELGIELVPVQSARFTWDLNFNFSSTSQRIKRLSEHKDLLFVDGDILFPDFVVREGEVLGNIYGYRYLGKMTAEDWESTSNSFVRVENEKYLNADTTDAGLNRADKVVLGNSIPDYTWNLYSSFRYKNMSIDFSWYAAWGFEKYNGTRAATLLTGVNRDINECIADTLLSIRRRQFYESDRFVEDASFIRLKSLTLHYSFTQPVFDKVKLMMSLSVENLVTFTKYKGYDPETTTFTDNNFSDNAIDRGAYPTPRAIYLTLNLTF